MLTEEWKWSRLGLEMKPVAPELLAKLLDLAANEGPIFDDAPEVADLDVIRRLCVIEAMPKLWNVANMFDYYQPSREAMVARLARAVSDRAEAYADVLCSSSAGPSFARRAIVQRTYATSAGIMCEVYKQAAAKDVNELRSMPELDRAVLLQQYAKIGMKYDHIISRHQSLMERSVDTANLILEAQGEQPRRSAEQGYAAG
jgi:type II secretory pathway predicted ATPase ExeA